MKSLEAGRLSALRVSGETLSAIGAVHYHRGRQAVYAAAKRELLEDLRQTAITQGTKASNGIEGIVIPEERYYEIVFGNSTPLTLHEQAVLGYRDALEYVHAYHDRIDITPETIADLHRRVYAHIPAYPAGTFRSENNEIVRKSESGEEAIVYTPPPWKMVEPYTTQLCRLYRDLRDEGRTDRFVLLAAFVLDFTAIHPFMNGNGRVSRLLTNLLAYDLGFGFVRYIPHERIIYDSRSAYYAALTNSSHQWARGAHDWHWWLGYLARVFMQCGDELERQIEETADQGPGYKSNRIREVIQNLPSHFTIRDIIRILPTVPRPTIMYVLNEERKAKRIVAEGRGPKAGYRKVSRMDSQPSLDHLI